MSRFEDIQIEKMQEIDLIEVAQLLTDAFETNPAYSLIFKQTGQLRHGLFWLFKTNLFLLNRKQTFTHIIRDKGSGQIIGTFSILPPGGVKTDFFSYFRIGLPGFIRRYGWNTLRRMLEMDSWNKQLLTNALQTGIYYYLSMVALREEYRGKGIGSYAIRNSLNQLAGEERSCHLMGLTTQLTENVTFYSKLGFAELDGAIVSYKGTEYYNCNMKFQFTPKR